MKRFWIDYCPTRTLHPMTYWVHQALDGDGWNAPTRYSPPLPGPVAGRGYPTYFVELRDVQLRFASVDEIRVLVDTLGRRVLPTTRALSLARGTGAGPNSHWLSRLPAKLKPWRTRQKLTAYLTKILAARFDARVEASSAS